MALKRNAGSEPQSLPCMKKQELEFKPEVVPSASKNRLAATVSTVFTTPLTIDATTKGQQFWYGGYAGFEQLPLEIRQHVYKFYMEDVRNLSSIPSQMDKAHIEISMHCGGSSKVPSHSRPELYRNKPKSWSKTAHKQKDKNNPQMWDRHLKKWIPRPPSPIALLLTSKHTYREALPFLYCNGTFEFKSIRDLKYILPMLGAGGKAIRYISILEDAEPAKDIRDAASLLQACTNLRILELSHNVICGSPSSISRIGYKKTPASLFQFFSPLMRTLQISYRFEHPNWKVLDLLDVLRFRDSGGSCAGDNEHVEFRKELKVLIAKDLGITYDPKNDKRLVAMIDGPR
ncbi:hypothetical protein AC578_9555 [Pseudocercospora eumusae]|uniref:DUF7730 domain-containing protein n=1 Tax=Pseudocercospora eumusae TaxID=321146 RepID=A0A139HGC3_9PEZI|nr:hypothetical protein AC578_9555 [Pseudocercospora eumusae]